MKKVPTRQHAVNGQWSTSRTAAGDAFSSLVVRIRQLDGLLTAAGDALAKPAGQTSARWWVLGCVGERRATVAQIARTLSLTRQSVQRVADLLEADGLVFYEENPRHRRAKLLQLTESGRAKLSVIQAGQRVWADAVGAEIGEQDLRATGQVLDRVATAVRQQIWLAHQSSEPQS